MVGASSGYIVMAKTRIVGTLLNSLGGLLTGKIDIKLDAAIVIPGATPDAIALPIKEPYIVTDGVVDLKLEETETSQVTYHLEVYPLDSPSADYALKPLYDFHCIVPAKAENESIDFSMLIPSGITRDTLDVGVARLAELLLSTPNYLGQIQASVRMLGEWNADTYYRPRDRVSFDGSSYDFVAPLAAIGILPTNTDYWQLNAARGQTGAGTTGNNNPYNAAAWLGQLDAPSRNAIRNLAESLATKTELATKANASGANLTGSATLADTPATPTSNKSLVNSEWVNTHFARKTSANLEGEPTCPDPAPNSDSDQITNTSWVRERMGEVMPAGSVTAFAGANAPSGWLLCQGQALNRVTYARLFAAIGTTYGVGDGTTTFLLPEGRGRTVIGAGAIAGLSSRALNDKGGAETHMLSGAELPLHQHEIYTVQAMEATVAPSNQGNDINTIASYHTGQSNSGGLNHVANKGIERGFSTRTQNYTQVAHNNMPPFIALNYIIKF